MYCLMSALLNKGGIPNIKNEDMSKALKLASMKFVYLSAKVIEI